VRPEGLAGEAPSVFHFLPTPIRPSEQKYTFSEHHSSACRFFNDCPMIFFKCILVLNLCLADFEANLLGAEGS